MDQNEIAQINLLQKLYKDRTSGLFLLKNTDKIYRQAKRHAELASVTRATIEKFKASIEGLSRAQEQRILRGASRRYSFRRYKFFGPNHIVLG